MGGGGGDALFWDTCKTQNYNMWGEGRICRQVLKMCEERLLAFSYRFVCPHGTTRFRLDWFLWKLVFEFISVITQLDAQNFCFTISSFHAPTCFEHMCILCIKLVKYCDTYTEMHGQKNVKKLVFEYIFFPKNCLESSRFVKIWYIWRVLYMETFAQLW